MHQTISYAPLSVTGLAVLLTATAAAAQSRPLAEPALRVAVGQASQSAPAVRRLTVEEAVRLAIEQNLGIQVERFNPQLQDLALAETRASWAPTFKTNLVSGSTDTPVTNLFAGGQDSVNDGRLETEVGLTQLLPTGGNYSVAWNSTRLTSTNFFNNFNPQLRTNFAFDISQPLVRNYKVDNVRQQLATTQKLRESSDLNLRATITQTMRSVKLAYWDLATAIDQLAAQRQSLDLARRLLGDNEKRVAIGTMAPIDIVEAQAEVARNQESVIVAEAAIKQAEDRLRTLILDPAAPDFWTVSLEPADTAPFTEQIIDVNGAVTRATAQRSDVLQSRNTLARNDISINFLRNQMLPDVSARATYGLVGVGGSLLQPLTSLPIGGPLPQRTVLSQRGFGSVLGDVFTNAYPAWTLGVQIGYPLGTSTAEASLAKARLQHSQAQTELRNLELRVAAEVRDVARQVTTNRQRVASARVARELAERRLDAEEKKFAAGIQTSFFVFQAQRDLAQARTNEVRAIGDYSKSLVDYDAVQEVPLAATPR